MTLLFLAEFVRAEEAFSAYLSNPKYNPRVFEEDSSYRLGIAQYGQDKFEESEATFLSFVEMYPESTLLSEAYAMLGDLRGAEADYDAALSFYRLAREKALNISQINYPLFQAAKVLDLDKRYRDLIDMMSAYLEEWGVKGDFAHAVNWKGKAYKALDEYPRALNAYTAIIDEYGNDADLPGIDLIQNEIINDYTSEELEGYQSIIREQLDESLASAGDKRARTVELRYQTVLAGILEGNEREALLDSVVQAKNVPASGAGTLVLIAQEGVNRDDFGLVHEATARFMSHFPVSNEMLYIMIANLDAYIEEGRYVEADELSEEILLKFGYSKSVGYARKRRGDAFRLQKKYDEALEAYKEVLSIREWRGPLTPEALFYSGLCKMEMDKTDEAFAYFQRIYVLYEEYTQWVAPAYARSIQCLELMGGHEQDIVNTCKEMLANEKVASTPEGGEAARRLQELQPKGEVL
jgi:TolA-binding protein